MSTHATSGADGAAADRAAAAAAMASGDKTAASQPLRFEVTIGGKSYTATINDPALRTVDPETIKAILAELGKKADFAAALDTKAEEYLVAIPLSGKLADDASASVTAITGGREDVTKVFHFNREELATISQIFQNCYSQNRTQNASRESYSRHAEPQEAVKQQGSKHAAAAAAPEVALKNARANAHLTGPGMLSLRAVDPSEVPASARAAAPPPPPPAAPTYAAPLPTQEEAATIANISMGVAAVGTQPTETAHSPPPPTAAPVSPTRTPMPSDPNKIIGWISQEFESHPGNPLLMHELLFGSAIESKTFHDKKIGDVILKQAAAIDTTETDKKLDNAMRMYQNTTGSAQKRALHAVRYHLSQLMMKAMILRDQGSLNAAERFLASIEHTPGRQGHKDKILESSLYSPIFDRFAKTTLSSPRTAPARASAATVAAMPTSTSSASTTTAPASTPAQLSPTALSPREQALYKRIDEYGANNRWLGPIRRSAPSDPALMESLLKKLITKAVAGGRKDVDNFQRIRRTLRSPETGFPAWIAAFEKRFPAFATTTPDMRAAMGTRPPAAEASPREPLSRTASPSTTVAEEPSLASGIPTGFEDEEPATPESVTSSRDESDSKHVTDQVPPEVPPPPPSPPPPAATSRPMPAPTRETLKKLIGAIPDNPLTRRMADYPETLAKSVTAVSRALTSMGGISPQEEKSLKSISDDIRFTDDEQRLQKELVSQGGTIISDQNVLRSLLVKAMAKSILSPVDLEEHDVFMPIWSQLPPETKKALTSDPTFNDLFQEFLSKADEEDVEIWRTQGYIEAPPPSPAIEMPAAEAAAISEDLVKRGLEASLASPTAPPPQVEATATRPAPPSWEARLIQVMEEVHKNGPYVRISGDANVISLKTKAAADTHHTLTIDQFGNYIDGLLKDIRARPGDSLDLYTPYGTWLSKKDDFYSNPSNYPTDFLDGINRDIENTIKELAVFLDFNNFPPGTHQPTVDTYKENIRATIQKLYALIDMQPPTI